MVARTKTWIANETLTAADLNAEFDGIISAISTGTADHIDLTDVYAWTGAHSWSAATTHTNTVTVGVDDTGHDVKFFGDAAGAFGIWDTSANGFEARGAAAAGAGRLLLSTAELTNVDGGILGRVDFQAPLDSAGTDAILVAASIWAEVDATFSASVNTTDLVFAAATSETATAVMRMKKASLSPETTDGMSLGTTALSWSDLFLDSGAVVNFDSGDVTVTHTANTLTVAGGTWATAALTATTITGSGVLSIDDTTESTSTVTGSIHTDGGVGIAKALWVGTTSRLVGAVTFDAGIISDLVTDSTSGTTGAIQTDGGLGVAKAIFAGTTVTANTMVLATGSLTDTTGAISFGNENLSTTGTLASGALTVTGAATATTTFTAASDLAIGTGSVTSVSGAISFGNENLTTTGTLAAGATTISGLLTAQVGQRITSNAATGSWLDFYNTVVDAGNRNWSIVQNAAVYGDLHFLVSAAADGNPRSGGTSVLQMTSAGNVGIGVTPAALLHVEQASPTNDILLNLVAGTAKKPTILFGGTAGSAATTTGMRIQGDIAGGAGTIGLKFFDYNNVEVMRVMDGVVGVAVAGPIDMTTTGNRIDFDTDNDTSIRASADDVLTFELAGADSFTMASTNIGIGVTAWGTSGTNVLGITADGTVPSTSPAGMIQIYADDTAAGATTATLALRTEEAVVSEVLSGDSTLNIWVNGVEYHLIMRAV